MGLGLRWRPRRLREVARVAGTGAGAVRDAVEAPRQPLVEDSWLALPLCGGPRPLQTQPTSLRLCRAFSSPEMWPGPGASCFYKK